MSRPDLPADDQRPGQALPTVERGPVRVHVQLLERIEDHVQRDTSVERGGVLVGTVEDGVTIVRAAIPASGAVGGASSLTFTHETWAHANDIIDERFPDQQMVGWYHSHPHFGIFLSEYDRFIHENFFSEAWQVAYVTDPLLGQIGFFGWQDEQLVRFGEWDTVGESSRPGPGLAAAAAAVADAPDSETASPTGRGPAGDEPTTDPLLDPDHVRVEVDEAHAETDPHQRGDRAGPPMWALLIVGVLIGAILGAALMVVMSPDESGDEGVAAPDSGDSGDAGDQDAAELPDVGPDSPVEPGMTVTVRLSRPAGIVEDGSQAAGSWLFEWDLDGGLSAEIDPNAFEIRNGPQQALSSVGPGDGIFLSLPVPDRATIVETLEGDPGEGETVDYSFDGRICTVPVEEPQSCEGRDPTEQSFEIQVQL